MNQTTENDEAYQVISQELHNEGRILVALLTQGIEFCKVVRVVRVFSCTCFIGLTSNSIIESLLGEVASLIRRVQNLVVEDGEVESQTKTDWVGWGKVGLGNFGGVLVSLKRLISRLLSLVTDGELGKVTVVISLPERLSALGMARKIGFANILW